MVKQEPKLGRLVPQVEPFRVAQQLANAFARRAKEERFTTEERAEFARMAAAWQAAARPRLRPNKTESAGQQTN